MQWNHLPVMGGIYDQHPQLIAEWQILWEEKGKKESAEAEKQKNEAKSQSKAAQSGRLRR